MPQLNHTRSLANEPATFYNYHTLGSDGKNVEYLVALLRTLCSASRNNVRPSKADLRVFALFADALARTFLPNPSREAVIFELEQTLFVSKPAYRQQLKMLRSTERLFADYNSNLYERYNFF